MERGENQILDKNTHRTSGESALFSNINAAIETGNIVKTTLGPMGNDKMLIDSTGEFIITNDGVKILTQMEITHPGAKLLVQVAKTQEEEIGDGTTTAVILCSELLKLSKNLIEKGIYQTNIIRAFKLAENKSFEILQNKSIEIDIYDKDVIKKVAQTAMVGKITDSSKDKLSNIICEAVFATKIENKVDLNKIKILKANGGSLEDSFIFKGIVLDKNFASKSMPKSILNPKVLLIDFPLEMREINSQINVNLTSKEEYEEFILAEENYLKSLVERIISIGAKFVVCQKNIDEKVSYFLAKNEIIAVDRTRKSDLEKLTSALNCPIINSFEDLLEENLGSVQKVYKEEILSEDFVFIIGDNDLNSITIFLKGTTRQILDEIERAMEDSFGDINAIFKSKRIVAGGGAIELELYENLLEFANSFSGKESLIIKEFAKSFLIIPRTLCRNCGLDEIDTMPTLIQNHNIGHMNCGINSFEGICKDTIKEAIIEPINIKIQAIKSATETSCTILRIDDIIAAKVLK